MRTLAGQLRPRPRDQAGFTVIEVVVAAMLLALGVLAVAGLVNAASHNDYRAQQSQVVNDQLQQELEMIKELPYSQVALTSQPAHSTDPANPNNRVSGTQFNVNRTGPAASWDLVFNGGHSDEAGGTVSGGTIDPGPTTFQSGNVSGEVYRYVVWEPETSCSNCTHYQNADSYNGQQVPWFKHVIVDVLLNTTAAGGPHLYQEVQEDIGTSFQDSCSPTDCPHPGQHDSTPWTFWLTDTPCSLDTRQPITADHLTHNTLGNCSSGPQTGITPGSPDLMFTQGAPCENNDCSTPQPLFDYATDVEPGGCGTIGCNSTDKGLQMLTPSGTGCLLSASGSTILQPPLGETNPQWKFHEWLSPQVPSSFTDPIVLDGTGNLELWTQTIGNDPSPGKICVWLFVRTTTTINGLPVRVDTPAVDGGTLLPYFTYSCPTSAPLNSDCPTGWPSGSKWSELHIPLNFALLTQPGNLLSRVQLTSGSRLGLAIGVQSPGTPSGSGLQFVYDNPTYDSRLILDTHSSLPF